ncbi:hypothetical protein DOTSEDRAFT_125358 [Dothistroma septosporum NZE10]|uniref:Uncharacterized protein n=1 Tax=Dothistroma septosporum (strain NZE10 / CBS 128990) TaxID=675120 RepID=N1PUH0_DOTSN|nr:hypothetical protein DOTSEDRAFT_125358 [Dothistroma septosporum NZE10]
MRFEDWDVLLFPSGTHDQHVPLREYRVECHAVADERLDADDNSAAPLMTSFVPSLDYDAPFQISVHSWMPKRFYYAPQPGSHQVDHVQMWQIKVIVDGITQCIETFNGDVKWPKVIPIANMEPPINKDTPQPLHFPHFHEQIMTDTNWSPHDTVGRIKIEISEGYAQIKPDDLDTIGPFRYYKLLNHAFFNFQPAPFKILQRTGVAFPSPRLESHILTLRGANNLVTLPYAFQTATVRNHARNMSTSSVSSRQHSSPYMGPGGPPNTPHFAEAPPSATAWNIGQ